MEQGKRANSDNKEEEEEEEDFFNVTIHQSGCAKEHYSLQDCYSDRGDWRKCTEEMTQFRACMARQKRGKSNSSTQNRNS